MERWLKTLLVAATAACAFALLFPISEITGFTFQPVIQFLPVALLNTILSLAITMFPAGATPPSFAEATFFPTLLFTPHLIVAPIAIGAYFAQSRWHILPTNRGLLGLIVFAAGGFIVPAYTKLTTPGLNEHLAIELGKTLVIAAVLAAYPIVTTRKAALGVGVLAGFGVGAFYAIERNLMATLTIPHGEFLAAGGFWLESLALLFIHGALGGIESLTIARITSALRSPPR